MPSSEQLQSIAQQVAVHAKYITDFQRTFDYGEVKLYSETAGKLVSPPDKLRRLNDFLAAAYAHAIAIYADSGDDCIDQFGNAIELKLAFIKGKDMRMGNSGKAIVTGAGSVSFTHAVNAKFRVYSGTDKQHHNKDTALVLMSLDHNCFISGFMLPGEVITDLVHSDTKNTVQRDVSLNSFIKYGYEFASSVPHIGWGEYYEALRNFINAKEKRSPEDEWAAAYAKWVSFADERNLKRL